MSDMLQNQITDVGASIEYGTPVAYRLKWYPAPPSIQYDGGQLVLQGAYRIEWQDRASEIEWRDIPTIIEGQE